MMTVLHRVLPLVLVVVLAFVATGKASASSNPIYTLPFNDDYYISCPYGCYEGHQGTDFVVNSDIIAGDDIVAALDGNAYVFNDPNFPGAGLHISMDHGGGNRTRYLHLLDWTVGVQGQFFDRGAVVGHEGATGVEGGGVHLHFETRINAPAGFGDKVGTAVDPFNPSTWMWLDNPPSYAPVCEAPPGGVADGGLYQDYGGVPVFITYDQTKYHIGNPADFEAMGSALGFWWDDIICVPAGYMDGVRNVPPDKTLIEAFQSNNTHVVACGAKFDVDGYEDLLIQSGYANAPIRIVPPGSIPMVPTVPEYTCHIRYYAQTSIHYIICSDSGGKKWQIDDGGLISHMFGSGWSGTVIAPGGLDSYTAVSGPNFCNDADGDGTKDPVEMYVGTWYDAPCGGNPDIHGASPSWAPDLVHSNSINIVDVLALKPIFGASVPSEAAYRFDLAYSDPGTINILDVMALKGPFGATCDPGGAPLAPPGPGAPESSAGAVESIAIDTGTTAAPGGGKSFDTIEPCGALSLNETITFDVVVSGVPEVKLGHGGLQGFQFTLNYDEEVIEITDVAISPALGSIGTDLLLFGDEMPDSDGEFLVAVADFGEGPAMSGDGVIITISATALAAGSSGLSLSDIILVDEANEAYSPKEVLGGRLVVGAKCE